MNNDFKDKLKIYLLGKQTVTVYAVMAHFMLNYKTASEYLFELEKEGELSHTSEFAYRVTPKRSENESASKTKSVSESPAIKMVEKKQMPTGKHQRLEDLLAIARSINKRYKTGAIVARYPLEKDKMIADIKAKQPTSDGTYYIVSMPKGSEYYLTVSIIFDDANADIYITDGGEYINKLENSLGTDELAMRMLNDDLYLCRGHEIARRVYPNKMNIKIEAEIDIFVSKLTKLLKKVEKGG